MTELVQSVRLKFDGSSVVGQAPAAAKAVEEIADAARSVGTASAGIAAAGKEARGATAGVASAADATRDLARAAASVAPAAEAIGRIAPEAQSVAESLAVAAAEAGSLGRAVAEVRATGLGAIGDQAAAAGVDLEALVARVRQLETELEATGTEGRAAATGMEVLNRQLAEANERAGVLGARVGELESKLKRGTTAGREFTVSAGQQRAAMQDLGYQISDAGTQILGGISPLRALTQQSGQVAFALSGMEGAAGSVGRFFAGPFGALVLIGVSVLGEFLPKLIDVNGRLEDQRKALDAAAQAADSYGNAQTLLGKVVDLTTGKFKTQNEVLIQAVKLQARLGVIEAGKKAKEATGKLAAQGQTGFLDQFLAAGAAAGGSVGNIGAGDTALATLQAQARAIAPLKGVLDGFAAVANDPKASPDAIGKSLDAAIAKVDGLGRSGRLAGKDLIDVRTALIELGTAANDKVANQQVIDVLDGAAIPADLKPYQRAKTKKPKHAPDTDGLVNSVQNDIRSFNAEFTDTPTFVEKARAAVAKLDQDIAQLAKKKPPNFQTLIDQAQAAKGTIEANIAKPFDDFVRQQQQSFEISKLLAGGHVDEANALREVFQLQREMGPLTDQQKASVLATVQALRAEAEQQQANVENLRKYHEGVENIRTSLEGAFTDGFDGIRKLPGELVASFQRLSGEQLFDKLFAGAFRELHAQVDGTSTIRDASDRMAEAVNATIAPLNRLATASSNAAGGVNGRASAGGVLDATGNVVGSFVAPAAPDLGADVANAITVTGNRLHDALGLFTAAGTKLLHEGVGLSEETSRSLGKLIGTAIQGAALGTTAGSIFGGKGGAGSALGGALGNFAGKQLAGTLASSGISALLGPGLEAALGSALPVVGSLLGGVAGDLLGGLFSKTRKGSATIGNVGGRSGVTGVSGNSSSYEKEAAGLGGGVASAIDAIVEQLGGTLGNYAVSIGKRKDSYRVDTSGQGRTKHVDKYDTAEEAEAAAIRDAIADGAIGGISDAMRRALNSSDDVNKGVAEALKVRDVQDVLTGLGGDLVSAFRSFEAQAKERVRIAQQYGFDVTKIEKINADDRARLVEQTMRQSVGSLKDLLESLKTGDLSEGDVDDRRNALLGKIDAARADVKAGKEGAADTLASLLQTLVENDREQLGTADPRYAADRKLAQTAAEQAIKAENDRIRRAEELAGYTNKSLADANKLADEGNDLIAKGNARLDRIVDILSGRSGGGAGIALNQRVSRI